MNTNPDKFGYEIRVKGQLDPYWADWFDGWVIASLENGDGLLSNLQADQSCLHSALNKIRDLNLILVSVIQVPTQVDKS